MHTVIKISIGAVVSIALIAALALWRPMTVSRLVWPMVEAYAIDNFVGVTTDGKLRSDLYAVESSGVSTQPVVDAANQFLYALSPEQRSRIQFPVDDSEWLRWANVHISTRQGVGFVELSPEQAEAAFALIAAGLSQRGYKTARDIMRLNHHLAILLDNHHEYGEDRYWLTIMGEPSESEPWGWQLDGHHLVVNFFVLGDQVVMTPTFMGSEPTSAAEGEYAGTRVLDEERAAGLTLINTLSTAQQALAIVSREKTHNNNRGELWQDNATVPYQGIRLDALNEQQRARAVELIQRYTGQLRAGHDDIKLTEILRHWDETYFSWIGGTNSNSVFYYRIHSPVVLIEFDHQTPIALGGPNVPSSRHIHTVVRTPNGNDAGRCCVGATDRAADSLGVAPPGGSRPLRVHVDTVVLTVRPDGQKMS